MRQIDDKISLLMVTDEMAQRNTVSTRSLLIDTPEDAISLLTDIRDKMQEHFICISLDGARRVIATRLVSIGTLNASLVHPREVFADAITDRAASIIVAHNHPSQTLKPSDTDIEVTKRLEKSGQLLGIKLVDHIIITKTDHYSIMCSF